MRKLVIVSTTALLGFSAIAQAGVHYVAADDSAESRLCVSAAIDKPFRFDNKVEAIGIPLKTVATKLDCNGINVAQFSANAGNHRTAAQLARYSPIQGQVDIREANAKGSQTDVVILVKGE